MKTLVKPNAVAEVAKPQGCTNLKLRQLMRRVAQHYDAEVGKTGLKGTQYSLLSYVVKLGPIRAVDLAAAMRVSTSTLSRNLQPLIAAGWIEVNAGDDARSRLISATEAGIRDDSAISMVMPKMVIAILNLCGRCSAFG